MTLREFAHRRHRLERLVAHRELQLARAYWRGDDDRHINRRRRKLRRAQDMLAALDERADREQVA